MINFCVVVPAHNSTETIAGTLKSISRQTYRSFRVVVVDNGSTDATTTIAASWSDALPSLTVLSFASALGPGKARNAGVTTCEGEWIAFCDADDFWTADHLAIVADSIIRNDTPRLLATKSIRVPEWAVSAVGKRPISVMRLRFHKKVQTGSFFDLLSSISLSLTPFHTCSVVLHSQIFWAAGGFEAATTGEDIHLWIRAGKLAPIELLPIRTSVVVRRRRGISSSVRQELTLKSLDERIDVAARKWLVPQYLQEQLDAKVSEAQQMRNYLDRLVLVQWRGLVFRGQSVAGIRGLSRHNVRWGVRRATVTLLFFVSLPWCAATFMAAFLVKAFRRLCFEH